MQQYSARATKRRIAIISFPGRTSLASAFANTSRCVRQVYILTECASSQRFATWRSSVRALSGALVSMSVKLQALTTLHQDRMYHQLAEASTGSDVISARAGNQ